MSIVRVNAPQGVEAQRIFSVRTPDLRVCISLPRLMSGCFVGDVAEADLPDCAFATASVGDDHSP